LQKKESMPEDYIYIQQLKERLSELDPFLVLLFGSYADGTPDKDSDIDLLVVTNDEFTPKSYDERIDIQLSISNHIFEIAKQVPIDLIVYTIPMYKRFIEQNSNFAKEVLSKGKILYERHNATVA
jgi:predicted nucleotidyltransferase